MWDIIPEFACRDWGKPWNTSVRVTGLQAKNLTHGILNTNEECYTFGGMATMHSHNFQNVEHLAQIQMQYSNYAITESSNDTPVQCKTLH
jgi:hypothetical protein